jgi:hypothetical protein
MVLALHTCTPTDSSECARDMQGLGASAVEAVESKNEAEKKARELESRVEEARLELERERQARERERKEREEEVRGARAEASKVFEEKEREIDALKKSLVEIEASKQLAERNAAEASAMLEEERRKRGALDDDLILAKREAEVVDAEAKRWQKVAKQAKVPTTAFSTTQIPHCKQVA